jgi:hypothetical protein
MAHLWSWDAAGHLVETPLVAERAWLLPAPSAGGSRAPGGDEPGRASAAVIQAPEGAWVLLAPRDANATLNGHALVAGVRVLSNRDEIRTTDGTWFFSTEEIARIEPCPGADRALRCPRCTKPIEAGTPAVRCPNPECGRWHHETAAFPCWSSIPFCGVCSGATDLGPDNRWLPEAHA